MRVYLLSTVVLGTALFGQTTLRKNVVADVAILEQSYCKADSDLGLVRLLLKVRFRYDGSRLIYLHKGIGNVHVTVGAASPSLFERGTYDFEFSTVPMLAAEQHEDSFKKRLTGLRVGGIFETTTVVTLPMRLNNANGPGVKPGNYTVKFGLDGWPENPQQAAAAQREIGNAGHVFVESIWSRPMSLQISNDPVLNPCK